MKVLKCTQRSATKLVEGLEEMSCIRLLRTLGLSSLEEKRLRGNSMAVYRSGERDAYLFPLVSSDKMHRSGSKLHWGRFRLDTRKHFFLRG